MHAVSKLSRKVSYPTRDDWTAVKRVMRYLKGRESYGIWFDRAAGATMTLFCDANFAGDEQYSSTTGCLVQLAGGPIHWISKRQNIISLSSTEAELGAICSAATILTWTHRMAAE